MKNNVLQRLLVSVLTLAMLAPITGYLGRSVDEVQAADKEDAIGYVIVPANEVTEGEIGGNKVYTSANYEDYLFAGWYTDAEATKAAASDATGAYARFVPEDVLSTKVQVTNGIVQKTDVERYKGNYVMRFVSSVDSTDYKYAGFELSYLDEETGEKVFVKESTTYKAFERIESTTGTTENGDVETYSFGPKVVDTKSEYLITGKWAVAPSDVDRDYVVRAYWMTKDGTKVYGKERCVSVNDGAGATGEQTINFTVDANLNGSGYTATYKNASNEDVTIPAQNVEVIPTGTQTTVRLTNADKNLKSVTSITVSNGSTEATGSYRNLYTKYTGEGTADTTWYNGTDTEFVIATSADLYGFASVVSDGETFAEKKVYVVADITVNPGDASTWSTNAPSYPWTSIGFKSAGSDNKAVYNAFAGTFDGGMHTISGIYHVTPYRHSGFFAGTAASAKIKNFKMKNSYFKETFNGYGYFGSIVGEVKGTFDTIYSNAIVETTSDAVGGMFGGTRETVSINNCWFAGTLTNSGTSRQAHGGVVGYTAEGVTLIMSNCLNSGIITTNSTANAIWTGGLIGGCDKNSYIYVNTSLNVGKINVPSSRTKDYGPILGGRGSLKKLEMERTYATTESCSYTNNDAYAVFSHLAETNFIGETAKTTMSDIDWTNTWTTVTGKTPKLKSFENESYGRVNTRWYDVHKEGEPYILYDAEDLYGLAAVVNSGVTFEGETILLGADIVVNEGNANHWDTFAPALSWTPIGNSSKYFKGKFDGQGHTISGLYLDTTAAMAGLFGYVSGVGTVQNLKLTNSYFKSSNSYLGAIAGAGYGSFYNIYCNAIVESSAIAAGGFIGQGGGSNQFIENCWFAGSVIKTSNNRDKRDTGGFLGHMYGGKITMKNCLNTGNVDVSVYDVVQDGTEVYPKAGGFIGTATAKATVKIQQCVNVADINVNEKATKGYGPFVGYGDNGSGYVTISDSYASDSCPVALENVPTYNNIPAAYATYTILAESNMKGSLAKDNMPNLEWNDNWKVVDADYPEVIFMYATAEDQALLSSLYEGRALYQGDMHAHAQTIFGEEDGKALLSEWEEDMQKFNMDFAASMDHKQITHIDDTDSYTWDESKFVYGSEGRVTISDIGGSLLTPKKTGYLHFTMIFKTKEQFASVLQKYQDKFNYNATEGTYNYDNLRLKKAEFAGFIKDVVAAGGFVDIPHPKQQHGGSDPLYFYYSEDIEDYYFELQNEMGKQVMYGFQVITTHLAAGNTKTNHSAWKELLANGYRVYATSGSDTHEDLLDGALTSIYASTCHDDGTKCTGNCDNANCAGNDKGNLLEQIRTGDYSAGAVGIKMCMYGDKKSTVMGGSCDFSENKRLVIGIGDIHYSTTGNGSIFNITETHKFQVEVYNEKGLVYTQSITPGQQNIIALDVEDCGLYRVEVYDLAHKNDDYPNGLLIGLSNPIWNDEYNWNNN